MRNCGERCSQRNILKPEISAFKSLQAFSSVMLLRHVVPFESRLRKIGKKNFNSVCTETKNSFSISLLLKV